MNNTNKISRAPVKPLPFWNSLKNDSHDSDNIIHLQRTVGNQAVQRLVKFGVIQASLRISDPSDGYEQEADRIVDQVTNSSVLDFTAVTQHVDGDKASRKCTACEVNKNGKEVVKISRKPTSPSSLETKNEVETEIDNANGGKAIDSSMREFMEARFGYNFGNVRIHDDLQANRLAFSIDAYAFTLSNDIFLENPTLGSNKKLIAHELTHVIQQRDSSIAPNKIQRWGAIEHKEAGNRAVIEFPHRARVNMNMTSLRKSPHKDSKDPTINTLADLFVDSRVLALAKKGGWVRVLVESGKGINKKGEEISATGLTGYISHELITKEALDFDQKLEIALGFTFSYGDIVSMGGDLFEDWKQLHDETKTEEGRKNLNKLRDAIDSEAKGKSPKYEDPKTVNKTYAERYKDLALRNISHFSLGGTSIETWTKHHTEAIVASFNAGKDGNSASLQIALAMNAFADHFLTDSFSAGHIRVPRKDIIQYYDNFAKEVFQHLIDYLANRLGIRIFELAQADYRRVRWFGDEGDRRDAQQEVLRRINEQISKAGGIKKVQSEFALYVAGAFSGILHDKENAAGLKVVSNAHPEGWTTYGDGRMNIPGNKDNFTYMLESVKLSKQDIVDAFSAGMDIYSKYIITGISLVSMLKELDSLSRFESLLKTINPFKALDYVPRPDPKASPLPSWKWGALDTTMKQELINTIAYYLTDKVQRELLEALPVTQEYEIRGPNIDLRPRDAARDILNEFLRNPISFLEAAFGKSA